MTGVMHEKRLPGRKIILSIMAVFSLLLLIMFTIFYMAKDNFYANTIYRYFNISRKLHSQFAYLKISKPLLADLVNLMVIVFYSINNYFLLHNKSGHSKILPSLLFLTLIEFAYSSNEVYEFLYMSLVDEVITARSFRNIDHLILISMKLINIGIYTAGILRYFLTKPPIVRQVRQLKVISNLLGVTNIVMFLLFECIFLYFPQRLIWVSKAASFRMFLSIRMPPYYPLIQVLPIALIVLAIALALMCKRYQDTLVKLDNEDFQNERILNASNLSTRTFAHYIKNELLGISADIDMIKQDPSNLEKDTDRIIARCNAVYEHLNKLQRNTNRIILRQKRCDIIHIISAFLADKQSVFTLNGIECIFKPPTIPIYIFADEFLMTQVLDNITMNSIEAMTQNTQKKLEYRVSFDDDIVVLTLEDNGCGLSSSVKNTAFDPFVSTKATKDNWGIGLSFAKRIIESHSGRISIENIKRGALVTIVLPRMHGGWK